MTDRKQRIAHIALVVRDYDEAIAFYCDVLGFELVDDTAQPEEDKRWVLIAPKGAGGRQGAALRGTCLLLAKARDDQQSAFVGNQAGGRVFLFLETDDFDRDWADYTAKGITVIREPKTMPYGKVAVFADLYGNQWDLIQFA